MKERMMFSIVLDCEQMACLGVLSASAGCLAAEIRALSRLLFGPASRHGQKSFTLVYVAVGSGARPNPMRVVGKGQGIGAGKKRTLFLLLKMVK